MERHIPENRHRPLQTVACGIRLPVSQLGLTQPGERVALAEWRADLAVGVDGQLVVGLGLLEVAQMQVDEAEAVQGVGRAAAVARFAVQAQCPLAWVRASSYWRQGERRASLSPFSERACVHQCPAALSI